MRLSPMAMVVVWLGSLAIPSGASAQVPGPQGGQANAFNRPTQTLSPYLNFNRGGDPAVNYFNGIRPFVQSGGNFGGMGNGNIVNGPRQTFFPYAEPFEPLTAEETATTGIRPTGHPTGYGNTMGYYGGSTGSGMRGTGAVQGAGSGAARPGTTRR